MTSPEFLPSHVVPPEGMATWSAPDTTRPSAPLDPLLPVQIIDRRGDWARALCSNGWSAWVDGRLLLAVPREPPAAAQPGARTADPRPLLGAAEGELIRYRKLIEELAAGQLDGESFARRTRGTRLGVVVDGDAVWLYDARHERWCYCDGVSLQTYAVTAGPSSRSGEREGAGAGPPDEPGPAADPPASSGAGAPGREPGPPAPDPTAPGPPDGPSAPPPDPDRTRALHPGEPPPPPPNPVGEIR
ncbi:hypothetical protein [Streptomyces sp. NEAU-S7GS2]|uniref:hypothetical protein n=1 Tax=Streptomyces sp. NEAU-S7GS2 TaxID=2202000 RepID=UPI00194E82A0|nr:hypothetical protein [Streptomyces sp. NEAU-S7GS2]